MVPGTHLYSQHSKRSRQEGYKFQSSLGHLMKMKRAGDVLSAKALGPVPGAAEEREAERGCSE